MNSNDLRKLLNKWVQKVGPHEAAKRLMGIDLGLAVTQKLIYGTYRSELSFEKAQAILREMAKDGFSLTGDAS